MNVRLRGIGMTSPRTRERMVNRLQELGIRHERVLDAMLNVPRHIFVEEAFASRAYEDMALPIGFGQTISQPYTVARMTELLVEAGPLRRVLEVGTGSGYQTAVLARLVGTVYSVERIQALQERAIRSLADLKLGNVRLKHGDGSLGWRECGPFDGVIVTAAPIRLPDALLDQLNPGGVLVAPVGAGREQMLQRIVRTDSGFAAQSVEPAVFVPLLPGTA
ncbi:protein-L-isoaspartate(D-aspartate) O-methyltransferase [Methylococcus geothermalis]|uniref:Protein-L-isoaspartate O-methyltransferase n=1 Tax=Methylococcus geothermalis TaxID=2681310 RepID=A0A858Q6M3_9GAMM|nr:protein-L-isoaspartate(D-aspartate) O-methyltransferase [Methylococcus geothermalis]QJD29532.1 protein-L-isoaspartate(D-aspartate) O-methyltransferase [Methylococcus geothermalis]